MRSLGILLTVVGALWLAVALGMDTTVSGPNGRVHNIGLLEIRRNHLMLGALATLVGVLLTIFGKKRPERDRAPLEAEGSRAEMDDLSALIADRGKTGLTISTADGRTVVGVSRGSSAEAAGILVGDRLIAINGELCEGSYKLIVLKLAGEPGTIVRVSVRRGDKAHNFELLRRRVQSA